MHRLDDLRRRIEALPALVHRETGRGTAVPYRCETFHVEVDDRGRRRYRRHRRRWTRRDQVRYRRLLALVAREMGADPRLFQLWALRESSYRPDAVHVLDPDRSASRRAWERMRYTRAREVMLERAMARARRGARAYYEARSALSRIRTFRDNPTYEDVVEIPVRFPDGRTAKERVMRWHLGYGPFGMNPVYFLPVWDATAPPWVFCDADGLAAAVTAVWSARRAAAECRALGYEPTYEVVNRRFSGGRCTPRPALDAAFRRRARVRGLDPDAPARLGRRFPRSTTDRLALLRDLYEKARARDLLSPYARSEVPWFLRAPGPAARTPAPEVPAAGLRTSALPPAGDSAMVRAAGAAP